MKRLLAFLLLVAITGNLSAASVNLLVVGGGGGGGQHDAGGGGAGEYYASSSILVLYPVCNVDDLKDIYTTHEFQVNQQL